MKLSVTGFAFAFAILWGGAILLVELANTLWPAYGAAFLEMASSLYPGYETGAGLPGIVLGTLYGLFDGCVCGTVFAWLYNRFSG